MKIVIAGGNEEAEFIIKMFSGKGDDLSIPRKKWLKSS